MSACAVTGRKPVDHPRQVAEQPRRVDVKLMQDPRHVTIRQLDQLEQPVLDFDTMVRP